MYVDSPRVPCIFAFPFCSVMRSSALEQMQRLEPILEIMQVCLTFGNTQGGLLAGAGGIGWAAAAGSGAVCMLSLFAAASLYYFKGRRGKKRGFDERFRMRSLEVLENDDDL